MTATSKLLTAAAVFVTLLEQSPLGFFTSHRTVYEIILLCSAHIKHWEEKTSWELQNRLARLPARAVNCYSLFLTYNSKSGLVLFQIPTQSGRSWPCSARLTSAAGPCLVGHEDFPCAGLKQVNKKGVRGLASEVMRAGMRQITKLYLGVDVVQIEASGAGLMAETTGSEIPEHCLPFLAYVVRIAQAFCS